VAIIVMAEDSPVSPYYVEIVKGESGIQALDAWTAPTSASFEDEDPAAGHLSGTIDWTPSEHYTDLVAGYAIHFVGSNGAKLSWVGEVNDIIDGLVEGEPWDESLDAERYLTIPAVPIPQGAAGIGIFSKLT